MAPQLRADLLKRYGDDGGARHPVLISLNDACKLTSLSRTAINRWRALGKFPAAVPLGDKRVAFILAEVEQWINDRIAKRGRAA